ncbi:unnamed protein product, partial [Rotaria sp. Silwood2]
RKRMSIIVRLNDQIFLFIKGAETSIWPHLSSFNETDMKTIIDIRFLVESNGNKHNIS